MPTSRAFLLMLAFHWIYWTAADSHGAGFAVHFDQEVYYVTGPGDQIIANILIDSDTMADQDQPVPGGLYSYGLQVTFDSAKANVGSEADVFIPPEMDFFGFDAPAFITVTPGEVGVHANVDQFNGPLLGYHGTLLATVTLTNLATAVDSYLLQLDFSRDLGPAEDFFLDLNGTTLDPDIIFVPSRVLVIPEPSVAPLAMVFLAATAFWRRRSHNTCRS